MRRHDSECRFSVCSAAPSLSENAMGARPTGSGHSEMAVGTAACTLKWPSVPCLSIRLAVKRVTAVSPRTRAVSLCAADAQFRFISPPPNNFCRLPANYFIIWMPKIQQFRPKRLLTVFRSMSIVFSGVAIRKSNKHVTRVIRASPCQS